MTRRKSSTRKASRKKTPISREVLQKQELEDLERKLSMDMGSFLVLAHEGSEEQIERARQKVRIDLLKYGPDMNKLAYQIGGEMPETVESFIHSLDDIIHATKGWVGWIDEQLLYHCFKASERLERELLEPKPKSSRKKKV